MKKKIFTLILLAFFATTILSACNSLSSVSGEFNQDSYVLSIDDPAINFFDELTVKGAEKNEIVLSLSHENILSDQGNGNFVAKNSGETYIFAKKVDKVIAKAKVLVKYKFSSPKNIQIDNAGKVSWDSSFVTIGSQTIFAESYKVVYAKYDEEGNLGQEVEITTPYASCNLNDVASYHIKIQALGNEARDIDQSKEVGADLNNGVVGLVTGAELQVAQELRDQSAIFKWDANTDACVEYDIYLEGFLIEENTTNNYFEFDYSRFEGGDEIELIIEAKDAVGNLKSSKSKFTLHKLQTPNVEYEYQNQDGFVTWDNDENASKYKIKVSDFEGNDEVFDIDTDSEIKEYLSAFEGGAYNIEVMAVGQSAGFYLNSDTTDSTTIAKITAPEIEFEINGAFADISLPTDAYSKNYRISCGGLSFVYNVANGYETKVNLSLLPVGRYTATVTALPNVDASSQTGVEAIRFGEVLSPRVVNSNSVSFDFYKLEQLGEITHDLNGSTSTISFAEIENANTYKLFVNDNPVETEIQIEGGKVYLSFENLNQIAPNGNLYTFKVEATRIEDEFENAVKVSKTKTVEILSIVEESASQTNGYFAWNEVNDKAEYYYEVYLTDENYAILTPDSPTISGTTQSTSTSPILEFGHYYTIKIFTRSTDANLYLNSDFADENAYFTQNFIATKQIQSPELTFDDQNDVYTLTIKGVEYGGNYKIYIDGQLETEIVVSEEKTSYDYIIANEFLEAKQYRVSVVASSGIIFDENLYTQSQAIEIRVERLAQTTFTMNYVKNAFGIKTNENLNFTQIQNSVAVEATLNNQLVLEDGYLIDLVDYSKYPQEFSIVSKYIAGENTKDAYYIDSIPLENKFERITAPTALTFDDGYLKWNGAAAGTFDYYEAIITIVNPSTSNAYIVLQLGSELSSYNLQNYIDTVVAGNATLSAAYRQAEKLKLELYSFKDGVNVDVYNLPSMKAVTIKGGEQLEIYALEKPTLMLDTVTSILSWSEEVENSTYDIYVDGSIVVEGHNTNSINLSQLGRIDFTTPKRISVQAFNSGFFDSPKSDEIVVEQIEIGQSISLSKTDSTYTATLNITTDQSRVNEVFVNGSANNVVYTQGSNYAVIDLANFADTPTFEFQLKAKNESEVYYYLDSKSVSFTLENLANKTINLEHYESVAVSLAQNIMQDNLRWTDFRDGLSGNSLQPIVYTVYVVNNGHEYKFVSSECELNLEEIESSIRATLVGDTEICIVASVEKDYVLTGNDAKGFYGNISTTRYTTTKLQQADISEVKVYENENVDSPLLKKMYAGIEIVFEDKWNDPSNIEILVSWEYANGESGNSTYYNLLTAADLTADTTKFMRIVDGKYHVYLEGSLEEENYQFNESPENVSLIVRRSQTINSTAAEFVVNRFNTTSGSTISDDGIISIVDTQNASYFLELKIADQVIYKALLASELGNDKTADLMTDDFFGAITQSGNYQISLIPFDENERILPCRTAEIITGYKLPGLNSVSITDEGNVNYSLLLGDFDDLIFTAKMEVGEDELKHDFIAKQVEGSDTDFYTSMLEILELFEDDFDITSGEYTFGFAVRKNGSINSNWLEFNFSYQDGDNPSIKRSIDLEQDYILFDIYNNEIETTAFSVQLSGLFAHQVEVPPEEEPEVPEEDVEEEEPAAQAEEPVYETILVYETREMYFYPDSTIGYWVTDLNGENGYYSGELGNEENLIYTPYYAISIRELLSEVVHGDVEIKIARIGKNDDKYYQYNPTIYSLQKLNKINDNQATQTNVLCIEDNILRWSWTQQNGFANAVAPTAYYVIFTDILNSTSTRIYTTSTSLDVRTIDLRGGRPCNISVIALNYNSTIVASDNSSIIYTMQYTTPASLEIVDGKIVFEQDSFRASNFMQDIINYFGENSPAELYHNVIGYKAYTTPATFTPQSLSTTKVRLKLTTMLNGSPTNMVYTRDVSVRVLFPDLTIPFVSPIYAEEGMATYEDSYIDLLTKYQALMLEGVDTIPAKNTRAMIDALKYSNNGIGDGACFVDDLSSTIPAGDYQLSVAQIGEDSFIESAYSEAIDIYIAAPPEVRIQPEEIDGQIYYTATVTPTIDMVDSGEGYTKQLATIYKMQFRYESQLGSSYPPDLIDFVINYDGSQWYISYVDSNENYILLNNVVSSVEWVEEIPRFKLNMTNLRDAMEEIGMGDLIKVNQLAVVNIITYSQDDVYVVNGKSGSFNVRYLDLKTDDIRFTNGNFVIETGLGSQYAILVKYKYSDQTPTTFTQNFVDGKVVLDFENSGLYEYISLALNGSISASTMNIASESYVVKGMYKLNSPTLTTRHNNINISYNSNDTRYMSTLMYNIANNISLKDVYTGEDAGFYFISNLTSAVSSVQYMAGTTNSDGDTIYPSELMAEEFFAYLSGNTGEFEISDQAIAEGDVLLKFKVGENEARAIMSSSMASIEAMMLPSLAEIALNEGDLAFDDRMVGINAITNESFDDRSGNVVYEIIVKYYGTDLAGDDYIQLNEEIHYSERNFADEVRSFWQIVDSSFVNVNYEYFSFTVSVLGALCVNETTPNAIKTIEGSYILLEDSVYYGPNSVNTSAPYGQQVLRSQTLSSPILTRARSPYLAKDDNGDLINGIKDGKLYFVIDNTNNTLYYTTSEDLNEQQHTANRLKVMAEYKQGAGTITEEVDGTFKFETVTDLGEENNIYATFTINEGQLNMATGPIKFYITIYGRESEVGNPTITSIPLVIDNVYKLSNVEEKYQVVLDGEKTYIDFTKYFEEVSIVNDYKCYQLIINYLIDGEEATKTITSSDSKRFELKNNITYIEIQAVDGQAANATSPKKLLYSDKSILDINQTEIESLAISWDSQNMQFEWQWSDGNTDEYEYFVEIDFDEGHSESAIVNTKYYMVQNSGTISVGGFGIRARKKTAGVSKLYSFSQRRAYEDSAITIDLFSGGNGTERNPYLIANEDDFIEIAKRNVAGKQFYFKLSANVTIDSANMFKTVDDTLQPLIQEFYGVLDGNDFKLTINASNVCDLNEEYNATIIGSGNVIFTQYSAIFHSISINAKIENMFIDYKISYSKLNSSNILFAPLSAYNYGKINNIRVQSFNVSNLSGNGTNKVFVGGITAINYGTVSNCVNTADIDYSMAQGLNLDFGYAGITLFNANKNAIVGSVTNCFNQGEKKVVVTVNSNVVYMAGITLINSGKVSLSGNDGALTLSARGSGVTSFTGYFGGIAITSSGTLEYLYNNGALTNASGYETLNYGGIVYQIAGGSINALVETISGQPLARNCSSTPINLGNVYASNNSNTHSSITTLTLTTVSLSYNGYVLSIAESDGVYTASIAKA